MIERCPICGAREIRFRSVLWSELINQWQLAPDEVSYVDRQQGLHCISCGCNLRAMALGIAIMRSYVFDGTFTEFVGYPEVRGLKILELNEAGELTRLLSGLPYRQLGRYPEVDMTHLPFGDGSFDLVVHSDTLEHVPNPVRGLSECRRVLRPGGFCSFTVPMIVGRLTRSRAGMPPSYHGSPSSPQSDYAVQTEYGCDAWTHAIQAGFSECRIYSLEYPAAQAMVCAV
jgi:SAM-dependent methyltransferase